MPDLKQWRSGSRIIGEIVPAERAQDAWRRIQRSPTTLTIVRKGAAAFDITVRLEMGGESRQREGHVGHGARTLGVVFGVRNHPDGDVSDTDIQPQDQFNVGGKVYTVVEVSYPPGEVQARIEAHT